MALEIRTIVLPLPLHLGTVNCYLLRAGDDFLLIDSGPSGQRAALMRALDAAGCRAGNLKRVILTHGDFDHSGNAAHLRAKFGVEIALHPGDAGMLEQGDMFWNRKKPNPLIRRIASLLFGFGPKEWVKLDHALVDGEDLTPLGFAATVIALPGHSSGSVGVLTADGGLFCGDLLENSAYPGLNKIMDDLEAAAASVEKLKALKVGLIYPGHGAPFELSALG